MLVEVVVHSHLKKNAYLATKPKTLEKNGHCPKNIYIVKHKGNVMKRILLLVIVSVMSLSSISCTGTLSEKEYLQKVGEICRLVKEAASNAVSTVKTISEELQGDFSEFETDLQNLKPEKSLVSDHNELVSAVSVFISAVIEKNKNDIMLALETVKKVDAKLNINCLQ